MGYLFWTKKKNKVRFHLFIFRFSLDSSVINQISSVELAVFMRLLEENSILTSQL